MKKPTVLIVDDSKPIICLLKIILGKKYNVYTAYDGFEALNWLTQGNCPNIVISDLQMPNINGGELITYLSNSSIYSTIPILVLSGADDDLIQQFIGNNSNIAGVLTKPFDPKDLLDRINNLLLKNEKAPHNSPTLIP